MTTVLKRQFKKLKQFFMKRHDWYRMAPRTITFEERVLQVQYDIEEYQERYYREHGVRIYPNHEHDRQAVLTCPTCRKPLKSSKKPHTVYVRTECVCCMKEVSKTVHLACRHANICRDCYGKLKQYWCANPPYFIFPNGGPVDITNEQVNLYMRKKSCFIEW